MIGFVNALCAWFDAVFRIEQCSLPLFWLSSLRWTVLAWKQRLKLHAATVKKQQQAFATSQPYFTAELTSAVTDGPCIIAAAVAALHGVWGIIAWYAVHTMHPAVQ